MFRSISYFGLCTVVKLIFLIALFSDNFNLTLSSIRTWICFEHYRMRLGIFFRFYGKLGIWVIDWTKFSFGLA